MLKYINLILVLSVLTTGSASATELFVRPAGSKPAVKEEPAPVPEEQAAPLKDPSAVPDVPELKEPEPQVAEPKSIGEMANTYFRNCLAQEHPMLDAENKQLMCGCTSAKIPEVMTLEQMKEMANDTPEGLEQRNRMMLFVYTPCIEYPTRAMVLYRCLDDPKLKALLGNTQPMCSCLAGNMASFMREKAGPVIELAIRNNEKDIDPLRKLMESRAYEINEHQTLQGCMKDTNYKQRF